MGNFGGIAQKAQKTMKDNGETWDDKSHSWIVVSDYNIAKDNMLVKILNKETR